LSRHSTAVSTLVVAPPGAIVDALHSALRSIPEVRVIDTVAGCLSAAQAMRALAPDLMIISGQIPAQEIVTLIEQSAHEGSGAHGHRVPRVLVLSASQALDQRFVDVGAFAVVTPWDSVEQLRMVIRKATKHEAGVVIERHPAHPPLSSGAATMGDIGIGVGQASE
jgi:DNA-binding NarL/FixJ family response regulator